MKNESNNDSTDPVRKMRFKPKVPVRKLQKAVVAKTEPSETKEDTVDKELLSKLSIAEAQDGFGRRRPKTERKVAPVQVAFGQGSTSLARTFGKPKATDGSSASDQNQHKEYVEPWDYHRTYYPVTLPITRPYSGDPEILYQGELERDSTLDESQINPAEELGLREPSAQPQMMLLQFPTALPFAKPTDAAGDSKEGRSKQDKGEKCYSLKDLPAGYMGKMQVYKSGKIKLKLGDILYDVSPGQNCACAQDVAVINLQEKHCCILGELNKRAVITPDIDALLGANDMGV